MKANDRAVIGRADLAALAPYVKKGRNSLYNEIQYRLSRLGMESTHHGSLRTGRGCFLSRLRGGPGVVGLRLYRFWYCPRLFWHLDSTPPPPPPPLGSSLRGKGPSRFQNVARRPSYPYLMRDGGPLAAHAAARECAYVDFPIRFQYQRLRRRIGPFGGSGGECGITLESPRSRTDIAQVRIIRTSLYINLGQVG